MQESYFLDAIRSLFAALDTAIYGLIRTFYDVMLSLSKISILDIEQINGFASKIYALLAVFMVFKITFSLINYLVNPEKVFDSSKGVQKILVNIVIVLGMIIITPTAFTKLYELQNAILDDNVIPKFIIGNTTTENNIVISPLCMGSVTIDGDGERFAVTIFTSFYQPEWSRNNPGISRKEFVESTDSQKESISNKWLDEKDKDIKESYCNSISVRNLLSRGIVNSAPDGMKDSYVIDYQFFISTLVGVAVLALIVGFCFDIAVRSIRLAFLQLIAPIPIVSYIDPDSSKNGMFKKWLRDVGKTWASLFIRLISIYFAIYLIDIIIDNMGTFKDINGNPIAISYSPVVNIFLFIGILMFAKKLPSLIEGILGIKLDGKFEMNPLKRIANDAIGGKQIAGFTTGTLSKAGALAVNKMKGKNWSDSWAASKEAFAAGYKSPGTMAGYNAGVKQLREEKKEANKAKQELKKYNEQRRRGQELFEQTIKRNEDGSLKTTQKEVMGLDGKLKNVTQYDTDDTLIFKNAEYRDSYKRVDDLKKTKLSAERVAKEKAEAYKEVAKKYGAESSEAKSAYDMKIAADKMLATNTKAYDLAVKEHEAMKKMAIYKQDAEAEDMLSYYKATNPDALTPTPEEQSNNNDNSNGENNNSNDSSTTDSDSPTSQKNTDADNSDDYDYDDMEDIFSSQYEDENEELFEESQNETEVNDDPQSEEKLDESVIRTFEQNEQNVKQIEKEIENKRKECEELRDKADDEINPKKAEEYREKMSNAANEIDKLMQKHDRLIKNEINYYDEHPKEAISKFRGKAEEAKKIAKEAERKIEILQKQLDSMDYSTPAFANLKLQHDKLVEQKDYYYSRTDKYLDKIKDLENKNK